MQGFGRPTKLTAAVRKRILEATIAGATLRDTASYAGINRDTLRVWRQENEAFSAEVEQAEGVAAVGHSLTIKRNSDQGDWRAAAWWLERRRSEEWNLKNLHEVSGKDGQPIQHEHGMRLDPNLCTVEEMEVIERVMMRQLAATGQSEDEE